MGLIGYYRKFIPSFSTLAAPLNKLLKKDTKFEWTQTQQDSFDKFKQILTSKPLLQYPDFSKPFNLTVDASGVGLGAVLSQGDVNNDLPISYASRGLNDAEKNYSVTEKECLAVVWGTHHFYPYLYGRKFNIYTDHRALVWLFNCKDPTSRLLRWRLKLESFDYQIFYKPGKINSNCDALSRNPIMLINNENKLYEDYIKFH